MRLTLYRISTGKSAQINLIDSYIGEHTARRKRAELGYAVGMPGDPYLGTDVPIIHVPESVAKVRAGCLAHVMAKASAASTILSVDQIRDQVATEMEKFQSRPVVYGLEPERGFQRYGTRYRQVFVRNATPADVGAVLNAIIASDYDDPPAYWQDPSIQKLLGEAIQRQADIQRQAEINEETTRDGGEA